MRNAPLFLQKIRDRAPCFGCAITSLDPVLTEALCQVVDAVWIDAEHAALSIETVQALVMATHTTRSAALVRVAWNDPVLIKPVLDLGADGVIVPMIRSAEDAAAAVAACRYPPRGIRGFGPRRASRFGHYAASDDYLRAAEQDVIVLVQIEHIDAARAIEKIVATDGLTGVVIGPNDLAFSMGHPANPAHPQVQRVMEDVLEVARGSGLVVGLAMGGDLEAAEKWMRLGVQWMVMETETSLMMQAANLLFSQARQRISAAPLPAASGNHP